MKILPFKRKTTFGLHIKLLMFFPVLLGNLHMKTPQSRSLKAKRRNFVLLNRGGFIFVFKHKARGHRIIGSRFVDGWKNKGTK